MTAQPPPVIRRRVLVSGLVQGVWYRDSCREEARRHGVHGYVRNLRDGRVEAAFEGPPDAVNTLCNWCRIGPPRAEVTHLDITDEPPQGQPGFVVC